MWVEQRPDGNRPFEGVFQNCTNVRPPFIIVILVIVKIVLKIERRIRYSTESIRRMVCKVEDLFQKIKNVSLQYSLYNIGHARLESFSVEHQRRDAADVKSERMDDL